MPQPLMEARAIEGLRGSAGWMLSGIFIQSVALFTAVLNQLHEKAFSDRVIAGLDFVGVWKKGGVRDHRNAEIIGGSC